MKTMILILLTIFTSILRGEENNCIGYSDSNAEVLHCVIKPTYYNEKIHLYIPLESIEKITTMAIHLHGFNLDHYDHFNKSYGDYGKYLITSKANAVLVIPESRGKSETYNSYFSDEKRTEFFISELKKTIYDLIHESPQTIFLSGHSGSYKSLNQILKYKSVFESVKAVGLFDATYGDTGQIQKWVRENYKNQNGDFIFYNVYVTGEKATAEKGSLILQKTFRDYEKDNIILLPIKGPGETLDQHFNILKVGGLTQFWEKASTLKFK